MSSGLFEELVARPRANWPPAGVKICGLTRPEDARAAVEAGAIALGFVFARQSPRRVGVRQAREMLRLLDRPALSVGVFVDEPPEAVGEIVDRVGLDAVQLHGAESPEYVRRLYGLTRAALIKAVRLKDAAALAGLDAYSYIDAWLLDAWHPELAGGTGERCDWSLAADCAQRHPTILAGGLTPENVGEALWAVRPALVDVSSGVEREPGIKDAEKLRAFIQAVRKANAELAKASAAGASPA